MRHLINQYQKIPHWLRNRCEILAICIALFVTVILGQMGLEGSVPALILFFLICSFVIGIEPYQKWQYRRKVRKQYQDRVEKINRQLDGRSREAVLDASPYEFSRWPDGDDCYVIGDRNTGQIVHSVTEKSEAELWILEKTLLEENNPSDSSQFKIS